MGKLVGGMEIYFHKFMIICLNFTNNLIIKRCAALVENEEDKIHQILSFSIKTYTLMRAKTIIFTVTTLFLLIVGMGCKEESSEYAEGYIIASFQCNDTDAPRNFCIRLENNKEYFITNSLKDDIFDFAPEVIKPGHTSMGNPHYFPDSLRYEYKIGFNYRIMKEGEINCPISHNQMGDPWEIRTWNWVILSNVRILSK